MVQIRAKRRAAQRAHTALGSPRRGCAGVTSSARAEPEDGPHGHRRSVEGPFVRTSGRPKKEARATSPGRPQDLRPGGRGRRRRPDRRRGRVLHPAGAVGLRQDDPAAAHRRLRAPRGGQDRARRPRRHVAASVPARHQHRVPGLRALPPHVSSREHRVRAAGQGRRKAGAREARRARARDGPLERPWSEAPEPALRRPAPAGRPCARGGQRRRSASRSST